MLFRQAFLDGIANGTITLAFRRWKRPTVRAGGTLLTSVGQLGIRSVDATSLGQITASDSRKAGYADRAALIAELSARADGDVFRIRLGPLKVDPRIALRAKPLGTRAADEVFAKLERLDRASPNGPWTAKTLRVIARHPAVRALDLAPLVGLVKEPFKVNVRKLKRLGLTESLETGYRLSRRGRDLLKQLGATAAALGLPVASASWVLG